MSTVSITSEVADIETWSEPERLSQGERADCRGEDREARVAVRVLAKELVMRALGESIDAPWDDLECRETENGRPFLELDGAVRRAANGSEWDRVHLSWSYTERTIAVAVWILDGAEPTPSAREIKQRNRPD